MEANFGNDIRIPMALLDATVEGVGKAVCISQAEFRTGALAGNATLVPDIVWPAAVSGLETVSFLRALRSSSEGGCNESDDKCDRLHFDFRLCWRFLFKEECVREVAM